ncbi:alpha/beta hydrolase family protein [Bosea sp. RAC05]|uniref:alpha/beta hydrolase family protein n=1 Tax=Bosea sp. RAC05 TaxID=1842539 RepID=UPI0009F164C8|nr:hypothetical protein [Bosea sp. RAC05]
MTMIDRRAVLLGSLAGLATGAKANQENLIMRRTPVPGEDTRWYQMSQNGPWNPYEEPFVVPFQSTRLMVHAPRGLKSGRLVVFSHGALTDPQVYRPILQHWASHGFVVVAPVHDDSIFQRGLLARRAEVRGGASWDVDRVLNDALAWDGRCEACRLPLEHVDLIAKVVGMEVNIDRPIVIGHEFGAYVVQILLGAKVEADMGRPMKFSDPRWYAGLMLSPQGVGIMGLNEDSWQDVTRPFMLVQPGLDSDFTGQSPAQRIDPFTRSAPNNKHLAWFPEARRNLPIGPRAGARLAEVTQFEDFRAVTTAFLYAYANYDEQTFSLIASDWPERATLGRVKVSYR